MKIKRSSPLLLLLCGILSWQAAKAYGMNPNTDHKLEQAYFAAGCFWKVQYIFSKVPGVVSTEVGYTGGHSSDPTYEDVCSDQTGHAETVKVEYDPSRVSYRKLLQVFWANHDPTTLNRQGPDSGTQYRSIVFFSTPEQKAEAISYKKELDASHHFSRPIVTEIDPATKFYRAEDYHQNYYEKHGQACY
jgi:peptide-methionine (S)-S-oxide reductase